MRQENKPQPKKDNAYFFKVGVTAFLTVAAIILFFFLIFRLGSIFGFLGKIIGILQPVIVGAAIAYLVNPIQNFLNVKINKLLRKVFRKEKGFLKTSKFLSIALSLLIFICIILIFFSLIIPEFSKSIASLIQTIPDGFEKVKEWVNAFLKNNEDLENVLNNYFENQKEHLIEFVTKNANGLATTLASGVINVVNFVKDFVIGIMVAVYILASKVTFKAHFKKILCAVFSQNRVNTVIRGLKKCDSIFGGFINGKLIDSLIIGVLCFIGVTILKMPYTVLISVVIGVTNIIPIFGPYIGTIPCAFLILLISPVKCVYFVLFIILLQTLDGNIIGPKILGESTGLSAFWVMVSIILGGGLFGVLGMLLGVPTFAVIYYIIKALLNRALKKRNLPTDTGKYNDLNNLYSERAADNEEKPDDSAEQGTV